MKKIVRLTESDLVRLVKKGISEQNNGWMNPEQEKMYNYVRSVWGKNNTLPDGGSGVFVISNNKTKDSITFDFSKKQITYSRDWKIDPTPISIQSKFVDFKSWFDKNNKGFLPFNN